MFRCGHVHACFARTFRNANRRYDVIRNVSFASRQAIHCFQLLDVFAIAMFSSATREIKTSGALNVPIGSVRNSMVVNR